MNIDSGLCGNTRKALPRQGVIMVIGAGWYFFTTYIINLGHAKSHIIHLIFPIFFRTCNHKVRGFIHSFNIKGLVIRRSCSRSYVKDKVDIIIRLIKRVVLIKPCLTIAVVFEVTLLPGQDVPT